MDGTDEELVLRTRTGDTSAFAELVRRYRDAAYGAAWSVIGEACEATEVAQDALFRAYRRLDQLREPSRFAGWLCRITMNLARNRVARARPTEASVSQEALEALRCPGPSGEAVAEEAEAIALVQGLMQMLPGAQRLTFALFYIGGYSEKELSAMLGLPVGTIKSRLSHARSRLKKEVVQMTKSILNKHKPDADFWRSATGIVTGRATSAATKAPVEGAHVSLRSAVGGAGAEVTTGPDGTWRAEQLVPDAYQITARHPDFADKRYREETVKIGPAVVVRPGQTVRGVDVQLDPGASISGRAVAADGSPVANAVVLALHWVDPYGEGACFHRGGYTTTDSDGRFGLDSLALGDYVVGVQQTPQRPLCYFPGTFSLHDADRVEASADKLRDDLVIRVPESGSVNLGVRVTDSQTAEAIAGARVLVNRRDAFMWEQFEGQTDDRGSYETPFLTRGSFQVTVGAEEQGYPRWSKWIDVQGDDTHVEVAFELPGGAVFEGEVVAQDGSELPAIEELSCRFTPSQPADLDGRAPGRTDFAVIRCDAPAWRYLGLYEGFQAESVRADGGRIVSPPVTPGSVQIHVDTRDNEWRVIQVSVGGKRLGGGETYRCSAAERVNTLKIVVGTNLGVVTGRVVTSADKSPLEGVWVHLSRQDGEPFRRVPLPTDAAGTFLFQAVPAGPYVIGVARLQGEGAPLEEQSSRVTVVDPGSVVHLDLVLAGKSTDRDPS